MRRRAFLLVVGLRALDADALAHAEPPQHADEGRHQQHDQGEREQDALDDRLGAVHAARRPRPVAEPPARRRAGPAPRRATPSRGSCRRAGAPPARQVDGRIAIRPRTSTASAGHARLERASRDLHGAGPRRPRAGRQAPPPAGRPRDGPQATRRPAPASRRGRPRGARAACRAARARRPSSRATRCSCRPGCATSPARTGASDAARGSRAPGRGRSRRCRARRQSRPRPRRARCGRCAGRAPGSRTRPAVRSGSRSAEAHAVARRATRRPRPPRRQRARSRSVSTRACGVLAHPVDARVVGVEHRRAVARQRLDQLALAALDRVQRSGAREVRRAHRGDHADRGPRHGRQQRDVAGDVHAHLEHRDLVLGPQPQQRQRQADLVVLVALVAQHRPALGQRLGDLLLGGRLGQRSGDARRPAARSGRATPPRPRAAPPASATATTLTRRPEAATAARRERRVPQHQCGRARRDGIGQEPMAVRALAGQREEGVARLDAARIDRARHGWVHRPDGRRLPRTAEASPTVEAGSPVIRRMARPVTHDRGPFSHGPAYRLGVGLGSGHAPAGLLRPAALPVSSRPVLPCGVGIG